MFITVIAFSNIYVNVVSAKQTSLISFKHSSVRHLFILLLEFPAASLSVLLLAANIKIPVKYWQRLTELMQIPFRNILLTNLAFKMKNGTQF